VNREGGLARALLTAFIVVLAAHALVYFLVNVLPDAALVALGIQGANQDVLSTFQASVQRRDYAQSLLGLLQLNLGETLDGVRVSHELSRGLRESGPRVLVSLLLVLGTVLAVAFARRVPRRFFSVVSFLPPYVIASLALLILLGAGAASPGGHALWLMAAAAVAVSPAALLAEQSAAITTRNLASDFARTMVAAGADAIYVRWKLLANLAAEIVPSLDKALVALVASLMFAEPILGLAGIGTTTVRAVRRADPELLVGVTLFFATCVAITRIVAVVVRRRFGLAS
jgi:ABC-type dipeptide/oligopeptide/nickel transport system permease component